MLEEKIYLDDVEIPNRVVTLPMEGCDCNADGTPSELTERKYLAYARSGAGIIWFEACAVCADGKTSERQMQLTETNVAAFRALTTKIREIALHENGFAPLLILQLTHSGRQSLVPKIAYRNPLYEKNRPICDENIVSDEYLDELPEKFASSALLAVEAGFDGVDVKSCHGYLLQELLSAYQREGRYGGSFENRSRCYVNCFKAVKRAVPEDFIVSARLGLSDMIAKPYGFGTDETGKLDLTEAKLLIKTLCENGLKLLNVTIGNPYYNPHVNRPFRKGEYKPCEAPQVGLQRFYDVEKQIKNAFPRLLIVGVGLSYYREDLIEQAERLLKDGVCDFVGFGRAALAYPQFFKDYQAGCFDVKKCCVTCSKCTTLMRNKCVSGCATFDEYYKKLFKEKGL